jgi:hypothetical protein
MQESTDLVAKDPKDNFHLSPLTIYSNRFTFLANEDNEDNPTPIYIQNVKIFPPLIQLPNQTAHQPYVIPALSKNEVRVQLPPLIHTDPLLIPSRPKALNSIPSNERRDEITE